MPSQPRLLAVQQHVNINVQTFVLLIKKGRYHQTGSKSLPLKFSISYFPILSSSHFPIYLYQSFADLL